MRNTLVALILGLVAASSWGDQLVILGGQTKEGTFQGFEKGRFLFLPSKGKFMKEQPSRVSKLVLPSPTKAVYETTDGKKEEGVVFKGYEKGKFIFVKDGKEVPVMAMKMKLIEPSFESEGGDAGGTSYPIPKVDLANFGGDLNADQQAVLEKFTAAKKAFDAFLAESTEMVQEMDKLKGPKREQLLNELRKRKEAEQPLRNDLRVAYKALVGAFSEQGDDAPNPAEKAPSKAVGGLRALSK